MTNKFNPAGYHKKQQKQLLLSFLSIFILLTGITLGVRLTQKETNILSKAQSLDSPITVKIALIIYDPVFSNGQKVHEYYRWNDSRTLNNNLMQALTEVSHSNVNFEIVETHELNEFPILADGFQFNENTYKTCMQSQDPTTCHDNSRLNYQNLFDRFDLVNKINNHTIDQVWIWGGPWFGFYESAIYTPEHYLFSIISGGGIRSEPLNVDGLQRTTVAFGFNYERDLAMALHTFGHYVEDILGYVYTTSIGEYNENNPLNRFTLSNRRAYSDNSIPQFNYAHCGNVHWPPNAPSENNASSQDYVPSDCDSYITDYPNLNNDPSTYPSINCNAWGCTMEGYYRWWLSHIPYRNGEDSNGFLTNWWQYLFALDNTRRSPSITPRPPSVTPRPPSITPINCSYPPTITLESPYQLPSSPETFAVNPGEPVPIKFTITNNNTHELCDPEQTVNISVQRPSQYLQIHILNQSITVPKGETRTANLIVTPLSNAPLNTRIEAILSIRTIYIWVTNATGWRTLPTTEVNYNLQSGWNLIGIPVQTGKNARDILTLSGCPEIHRWVNGGWESHLIYFPAAVNNFPIEAGKAYFIRCDSPKSFSLSGQPQTQLPILAPGWNSVSAPALLPLRDTLDFYKIFPAETQNRIKEIVMWANGGWQTGYIPGLPIKYPVSQGTGYFVKFE